MVTTVDGVGCSIINEFEVREITSTQDIDAVKKFSFSPNPASDIINIELELTQTDYLKLELYNSVGVSVYDVNINPNHIIDLSSFADGVYFIHLSHGQESITKKLLVVK